MTASADGYEPASLLVEFDWDSDCVLQRTFEGLFLGVILLVPGAKLFSIPWCTRFSQPSYEIDLDPVEPLNPETATDEPD